MAVLLPDQPDAALAARLARLREMFGRHAYLALTLRRRPGDAARLAASGASGRGGTRAHGRHRRRALSHAGTPHSAGCGHLHSRRHTHRRCRFHARTFRRPPFASARGNGAPVRPLSGSPAQHAAISPTPAVSAWTNCATSIRGKRNRADRAADTGKPDLGGAARRYGDAVPEDVDGAIAPRTAADRANWTTRRIF